MTSSKPDLIEIAKKMDDLMQPPKPGIGQRLLDTGASFLLGAVPAFLGTAFLAGSYAVCSGIAGAIGLGGGASVAAGVIGTLMLTSVAVPVGLVLGVGGIFGVASIPGLNKAKEIKGKAVAAGVVAGLAGTVALGYALSSDAPRTPESKVSNLTEIFGKPKAVAAAPVQFTTGIAKYDALRAA